MTTVATFFGGPDDGSIISLTDLDLARGYLDTMDSMGNTVRHTIVKLNEPKQVDDLVASYELRPTEGVW